MLSHRSIRVGDQIKQEIASIMIEEMRDPRVGFVTVTHVQVTNDLQLARVYLSIQQARDEKKVFSSLKRAAGFIRGKLARRLSLRRTPALSFFPDRECDEKSRLFNVLDDIRLEDAARSKQDVSSENPQQQEELHEEDFRKELQ